MTAIVNNFVLIASTLRNDTAVCKFQPRRPSDILNDRQLTLVLCQTSNSQTKTMVRSLSLPESQNTELYGDDDPLDVVLTPSEVGQHVEKTTFARIRGSIETSSVLLTISRRR